MAPLTVTVVMTRRGAADVVVATEGGGLLAEPEGAAVPVLLSSSSGADRPLVGAVAPERKYGGFYMVCFIIGCVSCPTNRLRD